MTPNESSEGDGENFLTTVRGSGIGVDEWVAQEASRKDDNRAPRALRVLRVAWSRIPAWTRFGAVLVAAAVFGVATSNAYYQRIGFDVCVDAGLVVGLNITVGLTGQFDLGYAAWFGCGAYAYAVLSTHLGVHLPGVLWIAIGALAGVVASFGVGMPTRRLKGDFQGLVTFFFAQAFFVVVNTISITGGPNGITNLPNLTFFGYTVTSVRSYYYVALCVFAVEFAVAWLLVNSRIGRAWRALKDDPFAASLAGTPVARLRLIAFVLGAGIAGAMGPVDAALLTSVFPTDFNTDLVLLLFAMLMIGGFGSLWGGVLGALFVNILLEILQVPGYSMVIFYGLLVAWVVYAVRPIWLAAVVVGLAAALEIIVTTAIIRAWPLGTEPLIASGQDSSLRRIILEFTNPLALGSYLYAALIVLALGAVLVKPPWRHAVLVPILALAAMTWENAFALNQPVTQEIFLGLAVVALAIVRPNGLLRPKRG